MYTQSWYAIIKATTKVRNLGAHFDIGVGRRRHSSAKLIGHAMFICAPSVASDPTSVDYANFLLVGAPEWMLQNCTSTTDVVFERRPTNRRLRSSGRDLVVSCTNRPFGDWAIDVAAPRLWNSLPENVKNAGTLASLRVTAELFHSVSIRITCNVHGPVWNHAWLVYSLLVDNSFDIFRDDIN